MSSKHGDREDSQESYAAKKVKRDQRNQLQRCSICFNMDKDVWHENGKHNFYYSEAHNAAAKGCRVCHCACAIVENYFHVNTAKPYEADDRIEVEFQPEGLIYRQKWNASSKQIMVYAPHGCAKPWNICEFAGREVNPIAGSDECLALASEWMSACLTNHNDCKQLKASLLPRRIIDVGQQQDKGDVKLLEDLKTTAPYAALSHCWGQHYPMATTTSNLALRKQGIQWDSIPDTFKDAITVTRQLNLRYLWIDSLCVLQGDDADWQAESAKMGEYYRNAQVVIAAGSALDSTHSFLAQRRNEVSNPFELKFQQEDGIISKIRARPVVETGISLEPLDKRAWTFQEQYLASRLLRYTDQEMVWICRNAIQCECKSMHISAIMEINHSLIWGRYCISDSQISTNEKAYVAWQSLIYTYTRRELTRQSDKLPAISGVAAMIQRKTASSYLAGLWKDNLLCDLWWETVPFSVANTTLRTMEDVEDPNSYGFFKLRTPPRYRAPSFSWASIDSVPVQYSSMGSFSSGFEPYALVLRTECTTKGINEYGEVIDGFIVLEALLVEADLKVACDRNGWAGFYTVERNGITVRMQADLPLVQGMSFAESGHKKSTVKRASSGDDIIEFTDKVVTIALGRAGDIYAVLVLGVSINTRGAYERLGIISFHVDDDRQCSIQEWFENAKQSVVTIV